MRIDAASAWRTDLVAVGGAVTSFDTPRCALTSWRSGETAAASVRVQGYYDRRWMDGSDVRFVIGGDVLGPMGRDVVPVEPPYVGKFIQDHGADRAMTLAEITTDVLRAIP